MQAWYAPITIATIAVLGALARLVYWMGRVDNDRAEFREFMGVIRTDIKEIRGNIGGIFVRLGETTVRNESPLRLTELGEAVSRELQARQWAVTTAKGLMERTKSMEPYDIQEFCADYVRHELDSGEGLDKRIRACAYRRGLTRGQVLDVLAIELRDKLIEVSPTRASESNEIAIPVT